MEDSPREGVSKLRSFARAAVQFCIQYSVMIVIMIVIGYPIEVVTQESGSERIDSWAKDIEYVIGLFQPLQLSRSYWDTILPTQIDQILTAVPSLGLQHGVLTKWDVDSLRLLDVLYPFDGRCPPNFEKGKCTPEDRQAEYLRSHSEAGRTEFRRLLDLQTGTIADKEAFTRRVQLLRAMFAPDNSHWFSFLSFGGNDSWHNANRVLMLRSLSRPLTWFDSDILAFLDRSPISSRAQSILMFLLRPALSLYVVIKDMFEDATLPAFVLIWVQLLLGAVVALRAGVAASWMRGEAGGMRVFLFYFPILAVFWGSIAAIPLEVILVIGKYALSGLSSLSKLYFTGVWYLFAFLTFGFRSFELVGHNAAHKVASSVARSLLKRD